MSSSNNKKYLELLSLIEECGSFIKSFDFNIILVGDINYSKETKEEFIDKISTGELNFPYPSDYIQDEKDLCDAMLIFYVQGNERMHKILGRTLARSIFMRKHHSNLIIDMVEKVDKKIMRSIASKPRKDFKDEAVNIMRDTWETFPTVPQDDMASAILEKFKHKGMSHSGIINWIQDLGLKPKGRGKKTAFHLVIKKEQ